MRNKASQIKIFRHIVLMWFILFSLNPCAVNKGLFQWLSTDYAKPLNKSKATAPASGCLYSQNDGKQISAVKKSKIAKQIEPVNFGNNLCFTVLSSRIFGEYSKTSSGNSPPRYILYKRLKIDIA